jgi:hypothetical protein
MGAVTAAGLILLSIFVAMASRPAADWAIAPTDGPQKQDAYRRPALQLRVTQTTLPNCCSPDCGNLPIRIPVLRMADSLVRDGHAAFLMVLARLRASEAKTPA